jgi:ribonuclease HII
MTLLAYDEAIRTETGAQTLCGVDEAGRGPLAGPVYAAAVILKPGCAIDGLNDSKKLSEKRRQALVDLILTSSVRCKIADATVEEIEALNILEATKLAMRRAMEGVCGVVTPALVLVDGNANPGFELPTRTVVGGDALSACIAAASVLAKTARDAHMLELDKIYPEYGFAKHKGYGTKLHYEMLDKYGPCPIHRESFLRKWRAAQPVS